MIKGKLRALEIKEGGREAAAKRLGISVRSFYRYWQEKDAPDQVKKHIDLLLRCEK